MTDLNLNRKTKNNSVPSAAQEAAKYLYSGAAAVLLVLSFIGFHLFYLHAQAYPGRPLTPPMRPLLIAHGIAMTVWMLLSVLQPLLIARKNYKLHMTLGAAGAVLAAAIFVMGTQVAIASAKFNPPQLQLWGLNPKQFMAVSLIAIVFFAVFIGIGIWKRRVGKIHRPMMLLGNLAIIGAAIDRIGPLSKLYHGSPWAQAFGPHFPVLLIGIVFVFLNRLLTKSFDRYFIWGFAALTAAAFFVMQFAPSPAWGSLANALVR